MKKLLSVVAFLTILIPTFFVSCNDETDAGPGESDSFIKLFGSQNGEEAADMLVNADGSLILLATQEIILEETIFKIKVIHTDELGNTIWETAYPQGGSEDISISYKAGSVISSPDGYLIIGESINADNQSSVIILQLNQLGELTNSTEFAINNGNTAIRGIDLAFNSNNEIKATGRADSVGNNIWVGTFSSDLTYQEDCSFFYAAASSNPEVLKSTYITANDEIVFGISGFQTEGNRQNGRLAKVPSCQPIPLSSPFIATSAASNSTDFTTSFIAKALSGFVLVGTTNPESDTDIFLARVDDNGVLQDDAPILYRELEVDGIPFVLDSDDEGFSVTQTADGGFLIGGSSESNSDDGGSDIFLIKTDFNGNVQWSRFYGDQNDEEANVLLQAPNGGFLVLGTTEFGGINTLILIKTDRTGNVN